MKTKTLIKKMNKIGVSASEKMASFVGTWSFIGIYTLSMIAWIILHVAGVLHIDSPDFIKWNLWLSYFAGIQASILLMAAERQAERDRKRDEHMYMLTKANSGEITEINKNIELLEEIVGDLVEEFKDEHDSPEHQ